MKTSDLTINALKKYFGYDRFRHGQQEIIEAVLRQQDVLAIMPTGGGKSICYQLPALLQAGVTLVISPLIALMQDQVEALQNNGIGATFINSSLEQDERRKRIFQILDRQVKLVYFAPETLLAETFLPILDRIYQEVGISTLAIDEAHCVSDWGHDFRPEYRRLTELRKRFPKLPTIALTATATTRVRQDILEQLSLQNPYIHVASFNRPNLYYEVIRKQSYEQLLQQIKQTQGAGIVYCVSRKQVDEVAQKLKQDGVAAIPYHAGISNSDRALSQTRWLKDDMRVIVATVAFGMGINKLDVRFVIHYDLPKNIEGYYQESGRAGRDGEPARCTLYFSDKSISTIRYLISQKVDLVTNEPLEQEQRIAQQQLSQIIAYAEGSECRRSILLRYFGEDYQKNNNQNCGECDNCRYPKPLVDCTILAQKFLSCVARTEGRFGMKHIIDVLQGSKVEKVMKHQHDRLSVYGIGKDLAAPVWQNIGRSLIHQGLVALSDDGYSILKLNESSWQILHKQREVWLVLPDFKVTESPTLAAVSVKKTLGESENDPLFLELRKLRKRLADEQSVPPYVIFNDATLREMVKFEPTTLEEFARISGVGDRKLAKYGEDFIRLIAAEPTQITRKQSIAKNSLATETAELTETVLETLHLFNQRLSINQICSKRSLKPSTIYSHLEQAIRAKKLTEIERLVSSEDRSQILNAAKDAPTDSIKDIFEYLESAYSYDEIRLTLAFSYVGLT
jgi:ATP-dependent DNA helicase RecQ